MPAPGTACSPHVEIVFVRDVAPVEEPLRESADRQRTGVALRELDLSSGHRFRKLAAASRRPGDFTRSRNSLDLAGCTVPTVKCHRRQHSGAA